GGRGAGGEGRAAAQAASHQGAAAARPAQGRQRLVRQLAHQAAGRRLIGDSLQSGVSSMLRWISIVFLIVSVGGAARAQTPSRRQQAKELMSQGAKAFRLGSFDKAIDDFKRSYDVYPDPLALYNLAQVY